MTRALLPSALEPSAPGDSGFVTLSTVPRYALPRLTALRMYKGEAFAAFVELPTLLSPGWDAALRAAHAAAAGPHGGDATLVTASPALRGAPCAVDGGGAVPRWCASDSGAAALAAAGVVHTPLLDTRVVFGAGPLVTALASAVADVAVPAAWAAATEGPEATCHRGGADVLLAAWAWGHGVAVVATANLSAVIATDEAQHPPCAAACAASGGGQPTWETALRAALARLAAAGAPWPHDPSTGGFVDALTKQRTGLCAAG